MGWLVFIMRLISAVIIMMVALYLMADHYLLLQPDWWQAKLWWQRTVAILSLCALGFCVYGVMLVATGLRLADLRGPVKATQGRL